jgi:6-phosphogluconolactonase (cycloisomerase 2 family)
MKNYIMMIFDSFCGLLAAVGFVFLIYFSATVAAHPDLQNVIPLQHNVLVTSPEDIKASALSEVPVQKSAAKAALIVLGAQSKIARVHIDYSTEAIRVLSDEKFQHSLAGGMIYDMPSNRLFVSSESGAGLSVYRQQGLATTFAKSFGFFRDSTHLLGALHEGSLFLFSSSYNGGNLGVYRVEQNFKSIPKVSSQDFGNANTHSSAFDSKNGVLAVANLKLNHLRVFGFQSGKLKPLATFNTPDPRSIIYDQTYQKFYLASETSLGQGTIKILEFGSQQKLTTLSTLPLGLEGSDIKVNHDHDFVMALQRERGREALVTVPLTSQGDVDSRRSLFSIPVGCREPRAFETFKNFAAIACDTSGINFLVYKLKLNGANQVVGASQVFSRSLSGSGLNSSVMIELN